MQRNVAKARTKDSLRALGKLTKMIDGQPRIVSDAPLIVPIEDLASEQVHQALEDFTRGVSRGYLRSLTGDRRRLLERFRYVHAARKVVGVGSVGTHDWIVLMLGKGNDDPLFLQLKEAQSSVLEPFLPQKPLHQPRPARGRGPAADASHRRRHARLGPSKRRGRSPERDFYIRQLWDEKGTVIIEGMNPRELSAYAEICSKSLARAHARSGDPVAIAAYLGTSDAFNQALADFAETYSEQNERNHAAMATAVAAGRITAQTGL